MSRRPKRIKPETDPLQIEIDAMVSAGSAARWRESCPYSPTDLFRYCAWMAGFNDSERGRAA